MRRQRGSVFRIGDLNADDLGPNPQVGLLNGFALGDPSQIHHALFASYQLGFLTGEWVFNMTLNSPLRGFVIRCLYFMYLYMNICKLKRESGVDCPCLVMYYYTFIEPCHSLKMVIGVRLKNIYLEKNNDKSTRMSLLITGKIIFSFKNEYSSTALWNPKIATIGFP